MTTLALTISVTNPDADDRRAMQFMIARENTRRALLTPPLSALPTSTNAERKASYETVLSGIMASAHASYIQQSIEAVADDTQFKDLRPLWADATNAQKAAAQAALTS